ncbi:hypothetical protein ACH9EU_08810 [Kocuria sp. M1R5S2]|uniref:hypothetical protein n=1 Tax=Kocuria rhizosphaerae TaxID=3376285 RepID=UPI0037AEB014
MSSGPHDQIKHPDSLTGTSEADAPEAPVVRDSSDVLEDRDVLDDPTLRGQDEADPDDEDAHGESTGVGETDLDPDDDDVS